MVSIGGRAMLLETKTRVSEGSVTGSLPHPTKGRAAGFIAIGDAPFAQPSCGSLSAMWNRRGLPNPEAPCASDLSSVVTGHDLTTRLTLLVFAGCQPLARSHQAEGRSAAGGVLRSAPPGCRGRAARHASR